MHKLEWNDYWERAKSGIDLQNKKLWLFWLKKTKIINMSMNLELLLVYCNKNRSNSSSDFTFKLNDLIWPNNTAKPPTIIVCILLVQITLFWLRKQATNFLSTKKYIISKTTQHSAIINWSEIYKMIAFGIKSKWDRRENISNLAPGPILIIIIVYVHIHDDNYELSPCVQCAHE